VPCIGPMGSVCSLPLSRSDANCGVEGDANPRSETTQLFRREEEGHHGNEGHRTT